MINRQDIHFWNHCEKYHSRKFPQHNRRILYQHPHNPSCGLAKTFFDQSNQIKRFVDIMCWYKYSRTRRQPNKCLNLERYLFGKKRCGANIISHKSNSHKICVEMRRRWLWPDYMWIFFSDMRNRMDANILVYIQSPTPRLRIKLFRVKNTLVENTKLTKNVRILYEV